MKEVLASVLFFIFAAGIAILGEKLLHAQTQSIGPAVPLAGCPAPNATLTTVCYATDGLHVALPGGSYGPAITGNAMTLSFAQITGQTTGRQIGNMTCTVSTSINATTQTETLSNCQ